MTPKRRGDAIQLAKSIRSGLHPFKRPRARDQGGANQAVRLTTEQRGQKSLGWPPKPAVAGRGFEVSTACTTRPHAFEDHLQGAWRCAGSTRASQMNYGTRSSSGRSTTLKRRAGYVKSAITLLEAPKESAARSVGRKLEDMLINYPALRQAVI
jgi:hypothetical protein